MQVRFNVTLPEWYDRKVRIWARLKGTNRSTLIGNIVQARIEANWESVEKELEEIAQQKQISRSELEELLLNGPERD